MVEVEALIWLLVSDEELSSSSSYLGYSYPIGHSQLNMLIRSNRDGFAAPEQSVGLVLQSGWLGWGLQGLCSHLSLDQLPSILFQLRLSLYASWLQCRLHFSALPTPPPFLLDAQKPCQLRSYPLL